MCVNIITLFDLLSKLSVITNILTLPHIILNLQLTLKGDILLKY